MFIQTLKLEVRFLPLTDKLEILDKNDNTIMLIYGASFYESADSYIFYLNYINNSYHVFTIRKCDIINIS